jgi:hypothetical protein
VPFTKCGLDEAFGFAVGLGSIWPDEDLPKAESFTRCSKHLSSVTRAIICHHALDANSEPGKVSDGGLKKSHSTFLALIGHDLDEGDARSISMQT